jgi:hypothetical protein
MTTFFVCHDTGRVYVRWTSAVMLHIPMTPSFHCTALRCTALHATAIPCFLYRCVWPCNDHFLCVSLVQWGLRLVGSAICTHHPPCIPLHCDALHATAIPCLLCRCVWPCNDHFVCVSLVQWGLRLVGSAICTHHPPCIPLRCTALHATAIPCLLCRCVWQCNGHFVCGASSSFLCASPQRWDVRHVCWHAC